MRYKTLKIVVILLTGIGLTKLHAQRNLNTSANSISGEAGSLSYSVGQLTYQFHASSTGSIATGIHHPYEVSQITGTKEYEGINISVTAFPNPTKNHLTLEVSDIIISKLRFQLFDNQGRILKQGEVNKNLEVIETNNLEAANYFITVFHNNQEIKTFKIIKK